MDLHSKHNISHLSTQTPKPQKLRLSKKGAIKSQSSSPAKMRSANGLEKFYISQHRKQALFELELVSNRIQQLQKLEEKAKKKIEIAQKISEQIQRAKERHELELQSKELLKELKRIEEDEQRRKNKEEKDRREEKIREFKESILKERKVAAKQTKVRSRELDLMSKEQKILFEKEKYDRKYFRYHEAAEHRQRQDYVKNKYSVFLKEEYEKRISEEKNAHLELVHRKKELEKKEAELVSRLANTEKLEIMALKNLECLAKVPLFHLGLRL
jgi:hypothetical protein